MKRHALFILILCFCFTRPFKAEEKTIVYSDNKVTFSADYVEFDQENNILFGSGKFYLKQDNSELRADEAEINLNTKQITARGRVSLYDQETELYGDKVEYNMETKKGKIIKGIVYQRPWIIYGPQMEKINEQKTLSRNARITSCDLQRPHYYLSTSKVFMSIDQYIFAVNSALWVDDVPVFYLPVFFKSLGERIYSFDMRPGYSKRDGVTVKSTLGLPLTSSLYLKLYIDYFEVKGTGKGSELNYLSENVKTTLYGYNIQERDTMVDRWNLRGAHWQRFNPYLIMQGNLRFQSDTDFNNTYIKESYERVVETLQSDVAFTASTQKTTSRMSFMRNDSYDALKNKFVADSISAPNLSFTTNRIEIMRSRFYYTYDISLDNMYAKEDTFYRKSGNSSISLTRNINLARSTVFTPRVSYRQLWKDRHSTEDLRDLFNGSCSASTVLRQRLTRWIDLNLNHDYVIRTKENTIKTDLQAQDKGIEQNHGGISSFFYLWRVADLKLKSGYDFHKNKNEIVATYKEKIDDIVSEISFKPGRNLFLSFRDIYDVYPRHNVGSSGDVNIGWLRTNWSYTKARKGELNVYHYMTFNVTHKTLVNFGTRYITSGPNKTNYTQVEFTEHNLAIVRDMHCFEFSLSYTKRGDNEEFLFNLQLKSDMQRKKRLFNIDTDDSFYPWDT
ncbi:MAG: LptA/OstA family protein [bacterium]